MNITQISQIKPLHITTHLNDSMEQNIVDDEEEKIGTYLQNILEAIEEIESERKEL